MGLYANMLQICDTWLPASKAGVLKLWVLALRRASDQVQGGLQAIEAGLFLILGGRARIS